MLVNTGFVPHVLFKIEPKLRSVKAKANLYTSTHMKSLFLTGYGLSVKVQNTRLVFKQGINDSFQREKPDVLELPASAANFDKVIIQGKGYVSTEALERLAESNINVIMLDKRGKLYSYFHQIAGHEPRRKS